MNGIAETSLKSKMRDVAIMLLIVVIVAILTVRGLLSVVIIDRRSPTVNAITQIQTAILSYDTEYSEMPDASNNARLIKVLSGDNPRSIEFLRLKPAQLSAVGQVLDEWETPLRISIDAHTKVSVSSAGPDRIFGTADDITSQ